MAQQLQSIGVTLHQIDSLKEEGGKQHQKRTTKKMSKIYVVKILGGEEGNQNQVV